MENSAARDAPLARFGRPPLPTRPPPTSRALTTTPRARLYASARAPPPKPPPALPTAARARSLYTRAVPARPRACAAPRSPHRPAVSPGGLWMRRLSSLVSRPAACSVRRARLGACPPVAAAAVPARPWMRSQLLVLARRSATCLETQRPAPALESGSTALLFLGAAAALARTAPAVHISPARMSSSFLVRGLRGGR